MDSTRPQYILAIPGGLDGEDTADSSWPGSSVVTLPNPTSASIDNLIPSIVVFTANGPVVHRNSKGIIGRSIRISGVAFPMRAKGDTMQDIVSRARPGEMVPAATATREYAQLLRLVKFIEVSQKGSSKRLNLYMIDEGLFLEVEPVGALRLSRPPNARTGLQYDVEFKATAALEPPVYNHIEKSVVGTGDKKVTVSDRIKAVSDSVDAACDILLGLVDKYIMSNVNSISQDVQRVIGLGRSVVDLYEELGERVNDITHTPFRWAQQARAVGLKGAQVTMELIRSTYNFAIDRWWGFKDIANVEDAERYFRPRPGIGSTPTEIQDALAEAAAASESVYSSAVSAAYALSASLGGRKLVRIRDGESLEDFAFRTMGSTTFASVIADVNDLSYPFVSLTGASGTVKPGDMVVVPSGSGEGWWWGLVTPDQYRNLREDEVIYGRDLAQDRFGDLVAENGSDTIEGLDLKEVSGVDCLAQTLTNKVMTLKGSNAEYPGIGLAAVVGMKVTDEVTATMSIDFLWQILSDDRIMDAKELEMNVSGNSVVGSVTAIGRSSNEIPVSTRGRE